MIPRACLLAIGIGILLRLLACNAHVAPRGDVLLDVGVARSLAAGEGFRSGFERGLIHLPGGDVPVPPQGFADQHAPLWPLAGAGLAFGAGTPFQGLQWGSLLAGVLLLALVWRVTDRMTEGLVGAPDGLPALAAALVALSFLAIDASANGSLYAAQALLVLLLVDVLAAPRPAPLRTGLVLGALLLLNHQCLVLLPLPGLVLLLGAAPGHRRRAVRAGAIATGVALACLLPWWIRNALVFGHPFHSVNGLYLLHRAGVPFHFDVEQGLAVARAERPLSAGVWLAVLRTNLMPNLLYVLTTGLFVWPGLLGVVAAGAIPAVRSGWHVRDKRLLALGLALLGLGAMAVVWPATKLRYLVVLVPLVVVLGVRILARPPGRFERVAAIAVVVAWAGVLLLTSGDIRGTLPDARPERWLRLALGGAVLLVLPLAARLLTGTRRWGDCALVAGLPAGAALAALVLFGPGPGSAYHSTLFAPDIFGQPAEERSAADMQLVTRAAEAARTRQAVGLAGPVELLAWPWPALTQLPGGWEPGTLARTLELLLARGGIDHVVLDLAAAGSLGAGAEMSGTRLLDGRLVVEQVWTGGDERAGKLLLSVTR